MTGTDTTLVTGTAKPRGRRASVTTTPAAPPLPAELETLQRRMRLPYLRAAAPDVLGHRPIPTVGPRRSPAGTHRRGGHRPGRGHPPDAA
jgi:hypothetical protein